MNLVTFLRLHQVMVGSCRGDIGNAAMYQAMWRIAECQAGRANDPEPLEFGALSLRSAVEGLRSLHDEAGKRAPRGDAELAQQAGLAADYGGLLLRDREATEARIAAGVAAALAPKPGQDSP